MVTTRRGVGAYRWELAMVAVTAVWGSTFVLVRDAVAQVPPFTFLAYREYDLAVLDMFMPVMFIDCVSSAGVCLSV